MQKACVHIDVSVSILGKLNVFHGRWRSRVRSIETDLVLKNTIDGIMNTKVYLQHGVCVWPCPQILDVYIYYVVILITLLLLHVHNSATIFVTDS